MKPVVTQTIVGVAALAAVMVLALGVGSSGVDLTEAWHADPLLLAIRLPRVLLAALAGAALAAAGVALQAILRNPLADPYVIGVSGGAALGGVLALICQVEAPLALPLWAFAGAVGSTVLLTGMAQWSGRSDPLTLLLCGTIFNAFAAALVTLCKTLVSATKAQEILFWLMGSLGHEAPSTLLALALYVGIGAVLLWLGAGALNLLALGDEEAASQGLPVQRARLLIFLAAALLVGAVVSVAGMIGFVGLVVPHVLRLLLGADHRRLLPASLFAGAAFLVVADALARLSFLYLGSEIPVGVITALTGGPFFLALLLRRGSRLATS